MDTRFWIWGGIVSIVLHGLLVAVLLVFGSDGRQKAVEGASPSLAESAQAEPPSVPSAEPSSKPATLPAPPAPPVREYEVRAGDTLGAIARRIGCSVGRLAEVNGSDVKTLSRLRIGQRLVLPE